MSYYAQKFGCEGLEKIFSGFFNHRDCNIRYLLRAISEVGKYAPEDAISDALGRSMIGQANITDQHFDTVFELINLATVAKYTPDWIVDHETIQHATSILYIIAYCISGRYDRDVMARTRHHTRSAEFRAATLNILFNRGINSCVRTIVYGIRVIDKDLLVELHKYATINEAIVHALGTTRHKSESIEYYQSPYTYH
jgi:hypothetical protein